MAEHPGVRRGGTLERLGFAVGERVAIVHADDIGMCHDANLGAFEALANGPATCGSVMVPCPWFREAAELARAHPALDLGVHLTLNAEWPHYRWGPVTGASAVPSLLDAQGCLPRTAREVVEQAAPAEVAVELRAQVERALEAGIDVTHLDAHMGTCLYPPFLDVYAGLAREFRVPVLALRPDPATLGALGVADAAERYARLADTLEADGVPLVDYLDANSLHFAPGEGGPHSARRLAELRPGLTYLICHPARAGEELRAITAGAHMREFERGFYGGASGREALERAGIRTVGMRPLRALMRGERA